MRFAMEEVDSVVNERYRSPDEFPEEEKTEGWKDLDSIVEEIETLDSQALAITADISDSRQVHAMVDKVIAEFAYIDVLIANAGMNVLGPFLTF